jgi:hypothetical protein
MNKVKTAIPGDYNPNSQFTNNTPPRDALCDSCGGGGKVWQKGWADRKKGDAVVVRCEICAGTGRNPLPISEVIWGLRRGNLVPSKSNVWNKS